MNLAANICALTQGQQPELMLFDLDGTLIDSVPDLASAVDSMLTELGLPVAGRGKVSHWVGNGADMLVRRALAGGNESKASAFHDDEIRAARAVFDRAYLDCLHSATGAFEGVDEFLKGLDVIKVLITNKPRKFTEPLLKSLGWQSEFRFILCGDDLSEKKPSPLPVLHACAETGIIPQRALMIGDSRHDIAAAKAAGVATIAVTYGYNHGEDIRDSAPDLVIDSFSELLA